MVNERTFKLERIKRGKPIFFTVCSQCDSRATIELLDSASSPIETITTGGGRTLRCWGHREIMSCPCDAPSIRIVIDNGAEMKVQRNPQIIIGHTGEEKGVNYTFHIEDKADGDADYNDYYINIVSWDYRG